MLVSLKIDLVPIREVAEKLVEIAGYVVKLTPSDTDDRVLVFFRKIVASEDAWKTLEWLIGLTEGNSDSVAMACTELTDEGTNDINRLAQTCGVGPAELVQLLPQLIELAKLVLAIWRGLN